MWRYLTFLVLTLLPLSALAVSSTISNPYEELDWENVKHIHSSTHLHIRQRLALIVCWRPHFGVSRGPRR